VIHHNSCKATDKKHAMLESIEAFCKDGPGRLPLQKSLLEIWKGFAADGEAAEPLAAEFAKASGAAPALRAIVRCNMHAEQRSMETALKSDPKVARILDLLVTRYSEGRKDAKGGLSRALKNSDRLRSKFGKKAQQKLADVQKALVDVENAWKGPKTAPCGKHAVSSAPSRFDSILEALRTIVLNYLAVVEFLVELSAGGEGDDDSDWAQEPLELLQEDETEPLLAGTCELLQIGKKYVHYSEGHLSQSNLITAARDDLGLKAELKNMFFPGTSGVPLCVSSEYSRGYHAILQQQMSSASDENGDVVIMNGSGAGASYHRRARTPEQVATSVASAMKKMQVVSDLLVQGNEADHRLGRSLHPFDVQSWTKECPGQDLENTLSLFAEVADVDVKELTKDMLSTMPFVKKEVEAGNGLLESWIKTTHVFKNRVKTLPQALYALISIWRGTGTLESWFHTGRSVASKNCMSDNQRRSRMRIRINGPPVQEFCKKKLVSGRVQYEPGPLCLLAQSLYASAYGTIRNI
jgi:hypothetical protein